VEDRTNPRAFWSFHQEKTKPVWHEIGFESLC
jgi:hypothetical protein